MKINQFDPDDDVSEFENDELLMAHYSLHSYFREIDQHDRSIERWNRELVIQKHEEVIEEMEKRDNVEHKPTSELDDAEVEEAEEEEEEFEVEEWAKGFVQAEDESEYIEKLDADYLLEANQALKEIDDTIDISDHMTLSPMDPEQIDDEVFEWLEVDQDTDIIGYSHTEDTSVALLSGVAQSDYTIYTENSRIHLDDMVQAYDLTKTIIEAEKSGVDVSDLVQSSKEFVKDDPSKAFSEFVEEYDENPLEEVETVHEALNTVIELSINQASIETEDTDDDIIFQVDGELIEIAQGEVIEDVDAPVFKWYIWQEDEADMWIRMSGVPEIPEPEQVGEFIEYELRDPDAFEVLDSEWRGPAFAPRTYIQGVDNRPVLFIVGKEDEEEIEAEVQAIRFMVERPSDLPPEQEEEDTEQSDDYFWHNWGDDEINTWINQRNLTITDSSNNGTFTTLNISDPNQFESLETTWEGSVSKPSNGMIAGGDKPRRVTYGVDQEGERQIQQIEFYSPE